MTNRCTALTHLITPSRDKYDGTTPPSYYYCVNAGVAEVHLSGVPRCLDRCECHEKPEDWRPGDESVIDEKQGGSHVRND